MSTCNQNAYSSLSATAEANLHKLAKIRNESVSTVSKKFSIDEIKAVPKLNNYIARIRDLDFTDAGVCDGLAYVKIGNGRVFYGYTTNRPHRRAYYYVKDTMPDVIDENTFLLAMNIAYRYTMDFSWPSDEITPPSNGSIVECGAYLGHKTVRFADELVPQGQILAIEMMADNARILRRNIEENGLQNIVTVFEAGVWNRYEIRSVKGKGRQRNSLIAIDRLTDDIGYCAQADTFDNIIDQWGESEVDFSFITVNGAEVEVIEGMKKNLPKGLFIAAPFSRDGANNSEICREMLLRKGYTILNAGEKRIFAKRTTS